MWVPCHDMLSTIIKRLYLCKSESKPWKWNKYDQEERTVSWITSYWKIAWLWNDMSRKCISQSSEVLEALEKPFLTDLQRVQVSRDCIALNRQRFFCAAMTASVDLTWILALLMKDAWITTPRFIHHLVLTDVFQTSSASVTYVMDNFFSFSIRCINHKPPLESCINYQDHCDWNF